jgi:hypothetical protein
MRGTKNRLALAAAAAVALTGSMLASAAPAGATPLTASHAHPLTSGINGQTPAPIVWNGTDLATTTAGANGNLVAYEQTPGATSWQKQTVLTEAANGGVALEDPSITATSTGIQIVAQDSQGNIWFFQQNDGQTTWSPPQYVGSGLPGLGGAKIAWTGVAGHTGTNSVITAIDTSGDVIFWYQNGSGWTQETVGNATSGNFYFDPAITATDKGIVIVSPGSNGAFYSWYQAYGAPTWGFDGSVGVQNGEAFGGLSLTWDGTNVDVAAAYADGNGGNYDQVMFLWKPDAAEFWSDEELPSANAGQQVDYGPGIAWSGFNLIVTAIQNTTAASTALETWWQGTTFTQFNIGLSATSASGYGPSTVVSTHSATKKGEVVYVAPTSSNDFTTAGLSDWTVPTGGTRWTKHTIAKA